MTHYYVATTPNGKFLGCYTIEEITAKVSAGQVRVDCAATEDYGLSYADIQEAGIAKWVKVSELLANPPATPATRPPGALAHESMRPSAAHVTTEPIERRSGWADALRIVGALGGVIYILVGIYACSDGAPIVGKQSAYAQGGGMIGFGLGLTFSAFLSAYLIEVFIDIRRCLRKLVDKQ